MSRRPAASAARKPRASAPSGPPRPERKRSRPLIVIGAVVVGIGLILILTSVLSGAVTSSQEVTAGTAWSLSPESLTPVSTHISWHSGTSSTYVYLVVSSGTAPSCPPSGEVAQGKGKSGAFTVTLHSGKTYRLYGCTGSTYETLNFSLSNGLALTWADVIGAPLLALGLPVLVVGIRGRVPRSEEELFDESLDEDLLKI